MSTSSKVVTCGAVCLLFTMFSAMSLRTLVNGTTSSRGPAATACPVLGVRKPGRGPASRGRRRGGDGGRGTGPRGGGAGLEIVHQVVAGHPSRHARPANPADLFRTHLVLAHEPSNRGREVARLPEPGLAVPA